MYILDDVADPGLTHDDGLTFKCGDAPGCHDETNPCNCHIHAAVSRGANLLDRFEPGWRARVDTDILSVEYISHCVLGQVFGDFHAGRDALSDYMAADGEVFSAQRFGFDITEFDTDYAVLDDAWRRQLKRG